MHTREIKRDPGTVNYRTVFVLTPQVWSEYRLSFLIEFAPSLGLTAVF